MKQKKVIIGNWKMAPKSLKEARAIFQNNRNVAGKMRNVQTVMCVPYVYLSELKKLVTGHRCVVGAQDVSFETDDAHTGEISASQLKSVGAQYVIVGHSERRAMGESDELISKKVIVATKAGITTVLCVGEKERDDEGEYTKFVKTQLLESLAGVTKKNMENVVIAYEPVWAIGKAAKREASPEDVLEMSIFIKKVLADAYSKKISDIMPILYGGSINQKNAAGFFMVGEVDGLLIGRASLKPAVFTKILSIGNGV